MSWRVNEHGILVPELGVQVPQIIPRGHNLRSVMLDLGTPKVVGASPWSVKAAAAAKNISESDALTVGDVAALIDALADVSESEALTVAEATTVATALTGVSESDGLTVAEAVTMMMALGVSESDALTVAEAVTVANPPVGEIVTAVTRFAARTGTTGSQSITTDDLGGLTPKAVLFIATRAITDGVAADHTVISTGAATGASNEWVISTQSEHGQGTTDTGVTTSDIGCIILATPGDEETVLAMADFTTFIPNGCTLNWSVVDAANLITAIFFAGDDLSAHATDVAFGSSENDTVDVTAPGFEPDLVIAATSTENTIPYANINTRHSIGFCSNDGVGGVVQRCISSTYRNGWGSGDNSGYTRDDCILHGIGHNGADQWQGSLDDFDANGFTLTTLGGGAGGNVHLAYLALNFGGVASSWVGTHSTPTSVNGNTSDTGPNFKPQLVLRAMTQIDTVNTQETAGDAAGSWGFSAMDADEAYSASVSDEEAASTTNSQSLSDDVAIKLPDDDGTEGLVSAFVSFDATGWTETYTAVKGTAALMPALAIEDIS